MCGKSRGTADSANILCAESAVPLLFLFEEYAVPLLFPRIRLATALGMVPCPISQIFMVDFFKVTMIPVAPVAQRYYVTSDTLGREFDPGKRDFSH